MIIAFDIDGILIDAEDGWITNNVDLAWAFSKAGAVIWVWSFGGEPYAKTWADRLLLDAGIPVAKALDKIDATPPNTDLPDLHIDDEWSPTWLNGIIIPRLGMMRSSPIGDEAFQGKHLSA